MKHLRSQATLQQLLAMSTQQQHLLSSVPVVAECQVSILVIADLHTGAALALWGGQSGLGGGRCLGPG